MSVARAPLRNNCAFKVQTKRCFHSQALNDELTSLLRVLYHYYRKRCRLARQVQTLRKIKMSYAGNLSVC